MKKTGIVICSLCILFVWYGAALSSSPTPLSITGTVKQPLNLTMEDLRGFESVSVRLNEVSRDGKYHGAFSYRGVPLRTLLDLAAVQKEETDFFKPVDLAVVISNREGRQTVLSWGEIYYRNPAEVLVAFSAAPVMPHKECANCHQPEVFDQWLAPLRRMPGMPKLVVANDFYSDRSLEDISAIEVVDLHPDVTSQKMQTLFSPAFSVTGAVRETLKIGDISPYQRIEIPAKQIGDGKGYHGLKQFGGAPLGEIIRKAGASPDLNTVLLISAPDGYRSLISYGELLLAPHGRSIMIADRADGRPLEKNGKFIAILPDDLSADRWVKAVEKIEVISMHTKPKLSVIGVGCADTSLITLEAVTAMSRADVFISPEDITRRFGKYMGNKPVLFDPLANTAFMFRQNNPAPAEVSGQTEKEEEQHLGMVYRGPCLE